MTVPNKNRQNCINCTKYTFTGFRHNCDVSLCSCGLYAFFRSGPFTALTVLIYSLFVPKCYTCKHCFNFFWGDWNSTQEELETMVMESLGGGKKHGELWAMHK